MNIKSNPERSDMQDQEAKNNTYKKCPHTFAFVFNKMCKGIQAGINNNSRPGTKCMIA
jgi:hypothetical protein